MAMKIFAIQDIVKGKLTPIDEGGEAINIDYANDCQLTLEGTRTFARKNGNDYMPFDGARKGTFTLNSEFIGMDALALVLGGTYEASTDTITVTGDMVTKSFTFEGTINVKEDGNNTPTVVDVKFYNISPQISSDISLNASEIAGFSIVFDMMVDSSNKFLDWKKHSVGLMGIVGEGKVGKARVGKSE